MNGSFVKGKGTNVLARCFLELWLNAQGDYTFTPTMTIFKRVSTLLILLCALYICFVSLLQLSIQADWGHQARIENGRARRERDTSFYRIPQNLSTVTTNPANTLPAPAASKPVNEFDIRKGDGGGALEIPGHTHLHFKVKRRKLGNGNLDNSNRLGLRSHYSHYRPGLQGDTVTKPPRSEDDGADESNVEFLSLGDNFYVYGAYWDARYEPNAYVRLLVLRPHRTQITTLECRFNLARSSGIKVKAEAYEMCENHEKMYGGWIYTCLFPGNGTSHSVPRPVALASRLINGKVLASLHSVKLRVLDGKNGSDTNALTRLLNISRHRTGRKNMTSSFSGLYRLASLPTIGGQQRTMDPAGLGTIRLGVCVPPLYGSVYLSKLINFVEMCRLLGADKVFLYIHDIPPDVLAFLRQNRGAKSGGGSSIISMINWKLPVLANSTTSPSAPSSNEVIWNHGQLLAIQHCLYTSMADYGWLLFMDTDEMLIPQHAYTWRELIAQTVNQFHYKRIAGISFESAFFRQDFQTQVANSIPYFQYLHRTKFTTSSRSKLLVRPSQVFELGIHHVSRPISGGLTIIKAKPNLGLLHHYRMCVVNEGQHGSQCEILVKDETILKYEIPLTISIRQKVREAVDFYNKLRDSIT